MAVRYNQGLWQRNILSKYTQILPARWLAVVISKLLSENISTRIHENQIRFLKSILQLIYFPFFIVWIFNERQYYKELFCQLCLLVDNALWHITHVFAYPQIHLTFLSHFVCFQRYYKFHSFKTLFKLLSALFYYPKETKEIIECSATHTLYPLHLGKTFVIKVLKISTTL